MGARSWWEWIADPFLVFLVVLCGYLLTASNDLRHNGDTYLRYQTTQAMVDFHRLWIADPAWKDTRVALGNGGHLYAFYAPGQAVLMAPLYVVGKVAAHHLHLPYDTATLYATRSIDLWLGALLALIFFALCRTVGYTRGVSAGLTLILAFASVAWPDAQSALEQTQVNLFVLLAVLCSWRAVRGSGGAVLWPALCGTSVGLAVLTRYDALLYAPVFLVFLLVAHRDRNRWTSRLVAYLAGLAPWLGLVGLWNVLRFGSPFLTGLHEQTLGEPFLQGLANLVISPGKGLVWYLPLLLLTPQAARSFYRRVPALSVLFLVLAVLPLLFYSNIMYWHGDPAWGPRYLYTAVPYLILPLGEILSRWRQSRLPLRAVLIVLVAASFLLNLAAVSVTQWRFWFRLEASLQAQTNAASWSGQPFHWGAQHYHYYWNPRQSPIVMQVDDVYQVARLQLLDDRRYLLTGHPDPYTATSPADNYSINTLAFWWADTRHPLLGARTRAVLAILLAGIMACAAAILLARRRSVPEPRARRLPDSETAVLGSAGS